MAGLTIFVEIALAGCAFLLYFLYALWREERNWRKRSRVHIRKFPRRTQENGELLPLYSTEELRERTRI
jgi:threonine/homoserine/homoserine lactone efflux protein